MMTDEDFSDEGRLRGKDGDYHKMNPLSPDCPETSPVHRSTYYAAELAKNINHLTQDIGVE